jgi:CHASE3 domain sensor protein
VAEDGNASDTSSQKRRGPKKLSEMSAEERAAHDKKVAERKAAKATSVVAAAPAAAEVPLPASPVPVAAEESHTIFAPFTYKGVNYLRNKRGDLLTEEYEWVGRYNSAAKTIDTKFAKPADLEDE